MEYLKKTFGLDEKVALVTGGNRGIGKAIVLELAKAGADVFVLSRSEDGMKEVQKEVEALGKKCKYILGDVSEPKIAEKIINACIKELGKLDILVNNAGMISRAPLLEGSDEDWNQVIDVNLNALYRLSKEAAKHMDKRGSGKIINIASMLSFQGGKFVPSYTASKHGVAGLTKAFANELAEKNIQTNAIAPGYIVTSNTAAIRADKKRNAEILGRIPAARWGETSDLAATAVFLASNASNYMNGHILAVDGGWLVR